jgi:hypothetical protein
VCPYHVIEKGGLVGERFTTRRALERLLSGVDSRMDDEVALRSVCLAAVSADVLLFASVNSQVAVERLPVEERLVAEGTDVGLRSRVDLLMDQECVNPRKRLTTRGAGVWPFAGVVST